MRTGAVGHYKQAGQRVEVLVLVITVMDEDNLSMCTYP